MIVRARRRLASLLLATILAVPATAGAAAPTVVLVAPSGDAFEARMRAELESMGFDVQVRDALGPEPGGGAVLAVARVVPGPPRRVEVVVVASDASSRVPSRTASIEAPLGGDEAVVSVRAAEQLRAFFQPLAPPPEPPPTPAPPPPEPPPTAPGPLGPPAPQAPPTAPQPPALAPRPWLATRPTAEERPRPAVAPPRDGAPPDLSVSAAVGAVVDVGGAALAASIGARLHLAEHLAVGLVGIAPITATSVGGPEGEAAMRAFVPGLDVAAPFELAGGALRVAPSVGLGVAILVTEGVAAAPYEGRVDVASAALPFVRLEVAPRLAGPVHASVQVLGGAAVPAIGVNFAEREAATWQPWGGAFLGITLDL